MASDEIPISDSLAAVTDKVDSKKTLYASNVKIHENMGLE
jgi:hypothetical protein